MFYDVQDFEHSDQKAWYQKKTPWIIAGVVLCLLAAGIGILTYEGVTRIPDVGGGVTIEADPDTKIYLGDKQVGTTQISFTWEELFGDEKHKAIATELPSPASTMTAEMVAGADATVLDSQGGQGGSLGLGTIKVSASGFRYLIRRADGQLDQVEAIIIDWAPANEPPRRYLLPLRLRKGSGATTVYFNQTGSGSSSSGGPSFMKAFGRPPAEIKKTWKFSASPPPRQFAEEMKSKGLWDPASGK
jgi:hypothetical protein